MEKNLDDLLTGPPCIFCKYNGPGFYQAGTHPKGCPWDTIGGHHERVFALKTWLLGVMARAHFREWSD